MAEAFCLKRMRKSADMSAPNGIGTLRLPAGCA